MGLNDLAPNLDQESSFLPASPDKIMDSSGTADDTNAESDDPSCLDTLNSALLDSVHIRINPAADTDVIGGDVNAVTDDSNGNKLSGNSQNGQYFKDDCDTMKTPLHNHQEPSTSRYGNANGNHYTKNGPNSHHGNHHGNHSNNMTDKLADRLTDILENSKDSSTDRESEKNDYNTELNNMNNSNKNNANGGNLQCHDEIKDKSDNEEPVDNWFSWVICLCAALIYMCNGGVFYSNGLLLPEFIRMLDCGEVVGTWVSSVQMGLCQFVGKSFLN